MSDKGQKQECLGCIGISEEHTCTGYADFLAMKADKMKCQACKSKDSRIAELEAENKRFRQFIDTRIPDQGSQIKRLKADNERLRAIATTVATFDCDCIEMPTIQIYEPYPPCLRCRAKAALKEGDDV